MSVGKFRIQLDCPVKIIQRLCVSLDRPLMERRHATEIVVVSIEAAGRLVLGPLYLSKLQFGCDRSDHARGHLFLQFEYVLEIAVIAFGPDVVAARCLDELGRDAHPVAHLAHAAFDHVLHAELAADLANIDRFALEGK